jgi:hypothetical protein
MIQEMDLNKLDNNHAAVVKEVVNKLELLVMFVMEKS